ncbi:MULTISPECIES: hypothetical protein [Micromonospora]|uniref:Uncharacterized protein n=1 Tax=Micromonospora sicca TaxID=2202420 RepID=A0A317DC06_9ACTN|nr:MULTISPECIES: hypothetical protein [unclassified Micromonospora]MBM0226673.1 hypothetical protein [Micromonospora sp. ATA51]PWR11236.1 hypothetical protein DKT69_27200 [Micromonospora sp. 4G51]
MADSAHPKLLICLPTVRAWQPTQKRTNRCASDEIVFGLAVIAKKFADILGAYVYLPVSTAVTPTVVGGIA